VEQFSIFNDDLGTMINDQTKKLSPHCWKFIIKSWGPVQVWVAYYIIRLASTAASATSRQSPENTQMTVKYPE